MASPASAEKRPSRRNLAAWLLLLACAPQPIHAMVTGASFAVLDLFAFSIAVVALIDIVGPR
ncbi:MAG: hypothetical protein HOW73_40515 [Polyangiaceae bacterium]|nr:hypothetical protein [Polyangiaceae bacterium]